ncbi:MAG: hypothetical protein RLY86_861 [Pseudomonadota bacterium]
MTAIIPAPNGAPLSAALGADWAADRPLPALFQSTPVAAVRAEAATLRGRLSGSTPPPDAGRAVAFLLTHFPAVNPPDPDGYIDRLQEAAAEYPPTVVETAIRCLGRTAKFAPSVGELVEAMDEARHRLAGMLSQLVEAARILDQQIEAARRTLELHPDDMAAQGRFHRMPEDERAAAVQAVRDEAGRVLDLNGVERPRTKPPVHQQARLAGWVPDGPRWGFDDGFHEALKRFDEHWTTGRPLAEIVREAELRQHFKDCGVDY